MALGGRRSCSRSCRSLCLAVATVAVGGSFPSGKLGDVPWWAWTGGVISAIYIVSMLVGAGQLGAGLFTGLTVTAAVITSVALDHFGLVGFQQHPPASAA